MDGPALMRRPGLRREILFSLGVLMLGAVFALGVAALNVSERLLLAQKSEALTQTARALAQALGEARAAGGDEALARAVDRLSRELVLDALMVVDPTGRVVASSRPGQAGRGSFDRALALAVQVGGVVTPEEVAGRPPGLSASWTFAAPLAAVRGEGKGVSAGSFAVSFPTLDVAGALRLHRLMILAFAFVDVVVILLFGNLLLGRVAVRPLQGLAGAARAFAAGDRSARAPVAGSREVASLAESFNEMADRVEEGLSRQQEQLAALTRANANLRAAQEELVRVEKLASVGRLAAGVAHEIGNPLSAILGYAGLLLRERPTGEAAEYLGYIERETERIRRIIGDLLDFSRPGEGRVEDLSLDDLAASALELVRPQPEFAGVTLVFTPGEGIPPVRGDRHQLSQVLVNLLVNAAQAMEGKGTITLSTSLREGGEKEGAGPRRRATDAGEPAGRVVRLAVRDTGPGVPPELEGRIFDPFFTTKPPGQGTGLGLSLAWGVVAAHRGALRVGRWGGEAGGPAGGAEFTIDLPAAG